MENKVNKPRYNEYHERHRPHRHESSRQRHHHHHQHHHRHRRQDHHSHDEGLEKLNVVLRKTCPDIRQVAGHSFLEEILGKPVHRWDRLDIGLDCDEVYPNIYVGNRGAAQNKVYLQRLGITHVLNTAAGKTADQVNTGKRYYEGTPITYMGLDITDTTNVEIDRHFEPATKFISEALDNNGKVFVHCLMGMSRSGAIVTAFLMLKLGMSAEKALTTVRKYRDIRPNYGFLKQLAHLERKIQKKGDGKRKTEDEDHPVSVKKNKS